MLMPNRSYTAGGQFRYGFNGQENDNDVKGTGNQQDYGMRIYDPRIGKFLSVDPLEKAYSMLSTYQFSSNTPIATIDLDGSEAGIPLNGIGVSGTPLSNYFDNSEGRKLWLNAMGTGMAVAGAVVTDVFITKGWMTRTLLASQVIGAFEHNTGKTPQERTAQDKRSREALVDAFLTWGGGKILGVSLNTTASVVKGLAKSRFTFAKEYYKSVGFTEEKAVQHIKGIDLNEKVFETTIKKGTELVQWTYLDSEGRPILGSYFTLPNADPSKLGIPLEGRVKTTVVLSEDTKFLQSISSDIESWLEPGKTYKGGEVQLFQTNVKAEIKK